MTQKHYDLAIIGAGSGNSLITPHWKGKKIALAEHSLFGGTCINRGCIPTKMFVRPATIARTPEEAAKLGITFGQPAIDWPAIRDRIFSRIDPIEQAGRDYRLNDPDIDVFTDRATLTGTHSFVTENGTEVSCDRLVIATGSTPVVPNIPGVQLPGIHTSDTIMRLAELPEKLVIVGGGYIACEFAAIFAGLGSDVTMLVRGEELMTVLDADVSREFTRLAGRQWRILSRTETTSFAAGQDRAVRVHIAPSGSVDGETGQEFLEADAVLIAIGRVSTARSIGAREAGFDVHANGSLAVDEYQRVLQNGSPVAGVFALGDVSTPVMLKHVANYEARVVAHNLENPENLVKNELRPVPSAVFTNPEIAQVGLTERQAVTELGVGRVASFTQRYADTAYGWALEDTEGFFKVVVDRQTGLIVGAHALGYQSSNLLQPVVMAMSFGVTALAAARGQYWIHPALSEVTENALLGAWKAAGLDERTVVPAAVAAR